MLHAGPQRLREVRVHVPEVNREPRVSAGGGGGGRGQAPAQGGQYYIYTIYIYIYIYTVYISTYLHQVVKLPDPTIFTITSPSQETSYFYTVENLCSNFRVCSDDVSKSKLFVKV